MIKKVFHVIADYFGKALRVAQDDLRTDVRGNFINRKTAQKVVNQSINAYIIELK